MLRSRTSRIASLVLFVAAFSTGCDGGDTDVGSSEDYATDGIQENTREARAVLAVANQLDAELLADEVGLSDRVVENLIAYRIGDDEVVPSEDDERFDNLAELDAVPMMGNAQFRALLRFGRDNGFLDEPTTPQGSGEVVWAVDLGSKALSESEVLGIAADGRGDVVVGGTFKGPIQVGLGADPLAPIGKRDAFVAKLGRDGAPLWSRAYGTAAEDEAITVVGVDAQGEILITSRTGELDVGCGSTSGKGDLFAKLDGAGACLWSKRISLQSNAAMALARDGRIAIATFLGTAFEGTEPLPAAWSGIILLAADGEPVAQRQLATLSYPSLAFGADGELAIAGFGTGNDYGGGAIPAGGTYTLDVAKLGPALEHRFSKGFVAEKGPGSRSGYWTSSGMGPSITVGNDGAIFVAAVFSGRVNLGGQTLSSYYDETATLVTKLTSDGAHLWSSSPLRSADFVSPSVGSIRAGADGTVYVTGTETSFEPLELMKLDSLGRQVWSKIPASRFTYGFDDDGRILVAGTSGNKTLLGVPRGGGFLGVLTP